MSRFSAAGRREVSDRRGKGVVSADAVRLHLTGLLPEPVLHLLRRIDKLLHLINQSIIRNLSRNKLRIVPQLPRLLSQSTGEELLQQTSAAEGSSEEEVEDGANHGDGVGDAEDASEHEVRHDAVHAFEGGEGGGRVVGAEEELVDGGCEAERARRGGESERGAEGEGKEGEEEGSALLL